MRADALGLFWQDLPKLPKTKEDEKFLPPSPTWLRADFLPFLEDALKFDIPLMSDEDLISAWQGQHELIFDIECYINYFLIMFKDKITNKVIYFERINANSWSQDPRKLYWIIANMTIKGFNSNSYDLPILALALAGKSNAQLKAATNMIIGEGYRGWQVLQKLRVKKLPADHIDIIEVAPLTGSLKIYGGRAGTAKMQDLPFHPETELSLHQAAVTRFYCVNDLNTTIDLDNKLQDEQELRQSMSEEYGVDLRSKSDAQIAEAVISHEIEKLTGRKPVKPMIEPGTAYKYHVPEWLTFQTPLMNNVLNIVKRTIFVVSDKGSIGMPPELAKLKINIGSSTYTMGIGGLHSNEKASTHFSDELYQLQDDDVESYYPRIILNLGLFPKHLGRVFLQVFNSIVERRLTAKHNASKFKAEGADKVSRDYKKTADSLKIVINGTFGKLGSKHSIFYSPDLLIQTTLTGQLALLQLIEMLELAGISVVSANTDGIVSKCPRRLMQTRDHILAYWQQMTAFKLEGTQYRILASKDVNNYFAVKTNGEVKAKGAYTKPGLKKNFTSPICSQAVEAYLGSATPIEETVQDCDNLQAFLSIRNVSGGAVEVTYNDPGCNATFDEMKHHLLRTGWVNIVEEHMWVKQEWIDNNEPFEKMAVATRVAYDQARYMPTRHKYLGKAIRWYYGTLADNQRRHIIYAKNGNRVPKTDQAKELMELPQTIPSDLDYDWYINEAQRILKDVGYPL